MISGNLGPRGDGYRPDTRMSVREAQSYHPPQIETFAQTDADMVAGFTMNYVEEAIGIAAAAKASAMPVAISFTLETDGRLPVRRALAEAIRRTDAETGAYPAYYMINCAHPTHFETVLRDGGAVARPDPRPAGQRLPAQPRRTGREHRPRCWQSAELGAQYRALQSLLPRLTVVGGCCGTDHRHVEAICRAVVARPS